MCSTTLPVTTPLTHTMPPPAAPKPSKDTIKAEAQRRADDAALKVNEDAKPFAANLRREILTRVHAETAKIDALFDADTLR